VQSARTSEDRIALYRSALEAYPAGPHAAGIWVRIARESLELGDSDGAAIACSEALKAPANPRVRADALRLLTQIHRQEGRMAQAVEAATRWAEVADTRQRFKALEARFDALVALRRTADARRAAQDALDAIARFRREVNAPDAIRTAGTDTPLARDADAIADRLRAFLRGATP
jgi:tetratricopeptide (TPR) repeat protein